MLIAKVPVPLREVVPCVNVDVRQGIGQVHVVAVYPDGVVLVLFRIVRVADAAARREVETGACSRQHKRNTGATQVQHRRNTGMT